MILITLNNLICLGIIRSNPDNLNNLNDPNNLNNPDNPDNFNNPHIPTNLITLKTLLTLITLVCLDAARSTFEKKKNEHALDPILSLYLTSHVFR